MNILKKGTIPEELFYYGKCYNCHTEVEFKQKEAKLTATPRDGDLLSVNCPVCKIKDIYSNAWSGYTPSKMLSSHGNV